MPRQLASLKLPSLSIFLATLGILFSAPAESAEKNTDGMLPVLFDTRERLPSANISDISSIRFLMSVDFPPFNFTDQNGRLTGFNVDLVREVCAQLKMDAKCQMQALPFDELEAAVEMGEGDAVVSGMAVTGSLRQRFSFSRPYMMLPARFVANKNAKLQGSAATALAKRKVGVVVGSRHQAMLKAFFPDITSTEYKNYDELFEAVKTGAVDAIFADGLRLPFWVSGAASADCCELFDGPYMSDKFLGEGLTIMANDPENVLIPAFDQALATLSRNGKLDEIYRRYFPRGLY
jgi:polar amino acid transport system substrate-binding protein